MLNSKSIQQRNKIIDAHHKIIQELRAIEHNIEKMLRAKDPAWREAERERSRIQRQVEPFIEQYWQWIPAVTLSQCPYCRAELSRRFDPVDLRGFWWMDRTQRTVKEPDACPHFCLLLGAVNLNGLPPEGGLFDCYPGPDLPYVIPRILEVPSITAVVSEIKMNCGYSAYPIAYFSQTPPKGKVLTQSWAQKEYRFTLEDGRKGWDMVDDDYDYVLLPWLQKNKLRWYVQGKLNEDRGGDKDCPFLNIKGKARPQRILDAQLTYR